jgi:hypothetical protein
MTRIVRTAYRYKRPSGERKAVALEGPNVVTIHGKKRVRRTDDTAADPAREPAPTQGVKYSDKAAGTSPIVTIPVRRHARFGDAEDLTPEEYQRRGDDADALWRELVRRVREDR